MFSMAKTNKRVVACEQARPKAFSQAKGVGALLSEPETGRTEKVQAEIKTFCG